MTQHKADLAAVDLVNRARAAEQILIKRPCEVYFGAQLYADLATEVEALRERVAELETGKRAPVQGYSAGIPWSMHLRAYDAYCKKYSSQPALIDLEGQNCRGGFGTEELDEFIPGWRDELSRTVQLLKRAEAAEARAVDKRFDSIIQEAERIGITGEVRRGLDEIIRLAAPDALTKQEGGS